MDPSVWKTHPKYGSKPRIRTYPQDSAGQGPFLLKAQAFGVSKVFVTCVQPAEHPPSVHRPFGIIGLEVEPVGGSPVVLTLSHDPNDEDST